MPQAEKKPLVITTSGRPLKEIARDLEAEGFEVEQSLDEIKIITGQGTAGSEDKLRAIKGVDDVSDDHPVSTADGS
jgi:hypothetical protein